jgi:hypothetical protein
MPYKKVQGEEKKKMYSTVEDRKVNMVSCSSIYFFCFITMFIVQSRPGPLRERTFQLRSLWWVGPHLSPLPHPIRMRRGEKQQESTNHSLGLCQDFCERLSK